MKRYSIAPVAASKFKEHHFSRILQRFKETGSLATKKRSGWRRRICIPENIEKLRIHINDHPTVSIAQAAQQNNLPVSSTYRMIRNDLKLFPYKAQVLTNDHKDQRLKFCRWFCENDIDPQSVIFSDKKWFCLNPVPNHQKLFFCCPFLTSFVKIGQELLLSGGGRKKKSFTERPCR